MDNNMIIKQYLGITYPHFLTYIPKKVWKRFCCSRQFHLFDESYSSEDDHRLVCDICQLMVEIKEIDTSYAPIRLVNKWIEQ
jgi:hypothetical protein